MAFFGKKKKKKKPTREAPQGYRRPEITAREYRKFKEVEKKPLTWYEKLAKTAEKVLTVNPSEDMEKELKNAISFTRMRITPQSVMSLFVCTILLFVVTATVLALTGLIPLLGALIIVALGVLIGYYLYKYPLNLIKEIRIKASSQVVLAVLYMVVSMRISPSLERALRFAASNIEGELAIDMRKLIWDLEMRKYPSAWTALDNYINRWKSENEEFAEALRMIRDSTTQMPERAREILNESLRVVLEGSKTRMKHYAQELKMPVMVIHMMGVILPVLGTIMAPLAAVFMADLARPEYFIIGYNIALPAILVWFINNTLRKRPVTFSPVGLEKHPDMPKKGHMILNEKNVPVWPISLVIFLALALPSLLYFAGNPGLIFGGVEGEINMFSLVMSMLVVLGAGLSMSSYFYLTNFQRIKLQDDIKKMEGEFELALFQLGNRISGGVPTEVAIEKSIGDIKGLKISDLFQRTLNNIRNLGMTFEQALFDKQYGSIKYYPSHLIKNIMNAIVDTSKKGVKFASEAMLRIAAYLKNIRETQEYIRDLLEESSSSMKFQAYFLTPMITGLIVSMADVIIMVLAELGKYMEDLGGAGGLGESMGIGMGLDKIFGSAQASISPEMFQFIIGFYLLEVIIILAMFLTKISEGDNKTYQWFSASKMIVIGLAFYMIVALISTSVFGDLIRSALSGLVGG